MRRFKAIIFVLFFVSATLVRAESPTEKPTEKPTDESTATPQSEYSLEFRGVTDFKRVQELRTQIESTLPEASEVMERQFSRGELIYAVSMKGEPSLLLAVVRDAVPVREGGPVVSADGDEGVILQWP